MKPHTLDSNLLYKHSQWDFQHTADLVVTINEKTNKPGHDSESVM